MSAASEHGAAYPFDPDRELAVVVERAKARAVERLDWDAFAARMAREEDAVLVEQLLADLDALGDPEREAALRDGPPYYRPLAWTEDRDYELHERPYWERRRGRRQARGVRAPAPVGR